jgi:hypothetical protein
MPQRPILGVLSQFGTTHGNRFVASSWFAQTASINAVCGTRAGNSKSCATRSCTASMRRENCGRDARAMSSLEFRFLQHVPAQRQDVTDTRIDAAIESEIAWIEHWVQNAQNAKAWKACRDRPLPP